MAINLQGAKFIDKKGIEYILDYGPKGNLIQHSICVSYSLMLHLAKVLPFCYLAFYSHVISFFAYSIESCFDITKTFTMSKLSKSHDAKMFRTRKMLHFVIAAILLCTGSA